MIIFLSHKMSGLTDEVVYEIRDNAKAYIESKVKDLLKENEEVTYIENYVYEDAPAGAHNLWYLGRSIQKMAEADYIYFCDDYTLSRGCTIEHKIVELYELKVLNDIIGCC